MIHDEMWMDGRWADFRWQWDRPVELNFIGTTTALLIGGIAAATGSVVGGAVAAKGAGKAANIQATAADKAGILQKQAADDALAFERERLGEEKRQYDTNQGNMAPWLTSGKEALSQLQAFSPFKAPTADEATADPGYQFRMEQGRKALEGSAAARGGLLTSGTGKQLERFGQDYASNEYSNVYNRKAGEYNTTYNQLSARAGVGQTAASQIAGLPTPGADSQIPNIFLNSGQQQGNALQQAGAARASGYASRGQIYGDAIAGGSQVPMNLYLLSQLARQRQSSPMWV